MSIGKGLSIHTLAKEEDRPVLNENVKGKSSENSKVTVAIVNIDISVPAIRQGSSFNSKLPGTPA